jgi:TP901 family phage tail tape measure protein
MPDQLVFNVTQQGVQQVVSLLQSLAAQQQAVATAQRAGAQASQQAAQANQQFAQAAQQATQATQQNAQATQQWAQAFQQAQQHLGNAGPAWNKAGQSAQQAGQQAQQAGQGFQAATVVVNQATQAANAGGMAWVSLGGVLGNLPGPIGGVASAFGSISVMTTRVNADTLAMASGFVAVGSTLAGAFAGTVEEARQFERTFAEVQIVTQATTAEMTLLQNRAIELGQTSQFTSQQVAKGFYELGSAGFTAGESLAAIQPITQAAMIGNLELGKTSQAVVGILRQFNLDTTQTAHVVDVMTTAVQGSVLHWNDVLNIVSNLRGRATQLNVSFEESAAVLMLMSNAGVPATAASTALGTALDRLSKHNGEAAKGLAELGVTTYDAQGKFVGLTNVLQQIEARLPHMTEEQANHALAMLGGSRAAGVFTQTLQQQQRVHTANGEEVLHGTELLKYWTDQLHHSDGAAKAAADIIGQTLDAELKNLHGSIQEASIRIGTVFVPEIKAGTNVLRDMTNAFVGAPPAVQATVAALMAVGSVTATATGAILAFNVANVAMGGALVAAVAGAGPLIAVMGVIGLGVVALAVAWSQNWGDIQGKSAQAAEHIKTDMAGIGVAVDGLKTQLGAAQTEIGGLLAGLGGSAEGQALGGLFAGVGGAAQAAGVDAGTLFHAGLIAGLTAAGLGGVGAAADAIEPILHAIGIQGQARAAEEGKRIGADFASNVADSLLAQSPTLSAAWSGAADALMKEFLGRGFSEDEARQATALMLGAVLDEMAKKRPAILDEASHLGDAVADGLDAAMPNVVNASKRMADSVSAALKEAKGNVGNAMAMLAMAGAQEGGGNTNQLAVERLLVYDNALKAVNASLATMTAHQRASYETMLLSVPVEERGAQAIQLLKQWLDQGAISQEQYNNATQRGTLNLKEHAAAHEKVTEAQKAAKTAATDLLNAMVKGQGEAVTGWAHIAETTGHAAEAARQYAAQQGVSSALVERALNGDTAAAQELVDALRKARGEAAALAAGQEQHYAGRTGYAGPSAGFLTIDQAYGVGSRMAQGFRENVGSGPEEFGQEVAGGFAPAAARAFGPAAADYFNQRAGHILDPLGAGNPSYRSGQGGGLSPPTPPSFGVGMPLNPELNAYLRAHPEAGRMQGNETSPEAALLRVQGVVNQEQASANLATAAQTKHYGPTAQMAQFVNPETGETEWKSWLQSVDGGIVANKAQEAALQSLQGATVEQANAAQQASIATQDGASTLAQFEAGTGLATHTAYDLGGALALSAAQSRAYTTALIEEEAKMRWAASQATAQALQAGQMLNGGVAGGRTAVGLTTTQIYGGTATGGGASGGTGGAFTPTSMYGIPILSPVTPGMLRGYATGGLIPEDVMGGGLRSGDPYLFHAGETVIPAGGGGTLHVTFQVNAGLGADHVLRQNDLWESIMRDQLLPAAGRLGIRLN